MNGNWYPWSTGSYPEEYWFGFDGYSNGKTESWSNWQWPNEVFDTMMDRFRKLSTTKPISINDFGTTSGKYSDIVWNNFTAYSVYYNKIVHLYSIFSHHN